MHVDTLSIPAWNKTILKAMQKYGMYFRDGGGAFTIYAENVANPPAASPTYPPEILDSTYPSLYVPWDRLRVLDHPDPANR